MAAGNKLSIKKDDILQFLIAFSIMTTSGANWSIFFLVIVGGIACCLKRRVVAKHFVAATILSALLFVNSKILNFARFDMHEFAVYIARFYGIAMIASYISYEKFMKNYVEILYVIFAITIPFWMIAMVLNYCGFGGIIPYKLFDLFLMDSTSSLLRLKGIFWEGGVCAIQANIGLTYCIYKDLNNKKIKKRAVIFLLAVVCSVSTTGYIVLALQLLIYCIKELNKFSIPKKVAVIAIILMFVFMVEELTSGVVVGKLFGEEHSYTSRYDDTLLALLITKDHFLTGIGVATDHHAVFLDYVHNNPIYLSMRKYFTDDMASSNGLGNCMYKAGVPFTMIYLFAIYRMVRNRARLPLVESMIILIMYVCFFFGEPIMPVPFMLMFFFPIEITESSREEVKDEFKKAICTRASISNSTSI